MCLTYSSFYFSVGGHQNVRLLHDAAREVADASLLFSVIRVLYLQTHNAVKTPEGTTPTAAHLYLISPKKHVSSN